MFDALTLVGFAVLLGVLAGSLTNRIKLPTVAAYVLVGVLFGGSALNVFSDQAIQEINVISDIALAIIAFVIGGELRWKSMAALGRCVFFIVVCEAVAAFSLVSVGVFLLTKNLPLSLILGAIASSTAPAAIMMVIEELRASGTFTKTLVAVVAIDDGVALIIYSFAAAIAKTLLSGTGAISVAHIVQHAGYELIGSLGLGIVAAAILIPIARFFNKPDGLFVVVVGMILLLSGLANHFNFSVLLVNMSFGVVLTNFVSLPVNKAFTLLKKVSTPLLIAFFIFAGAQLRIGQIPQVWVLGLVYLVCYFVGKIGGGSLGAIVGGAPDSVRKYIGFGLIPQVGVAVGLVLMVSLEFSNLGAAGAHVSEVVRNVILSTSLITEIIGPILTRYALIKAGDVDSDLIKEP